MIPTETCGLRKPLASRRRLVRLFPNNYDPNTNRRGDESYDGAGNQASVNGDTMTYDAENRQIQAFDNATQTSETYAYDGNGQRVQKSGPGGTVTFVYDAFGQLAAQYSGLQQQDYIWFNGQIVAMENSDASAPCTTCYFHFDPLGSIRMITDENANVVSRHDYMPFGDEIPAGSAERYANLGYQANDSVNQRFTGQYRDTETNGLDYFNARYFGSTLGRFTRPDLMNAGADASDPQTWNGYAYVRNNPLNATDPSGENLVDWFSGIWDAIAGFFGGGGGGGSASCTITPCFSTTGYGTPLPTGGGGGGSGYLPILLPGVPASGGGGGAAAGRLVVSRNSRRRSRSWPQRTGPAIP